MEPGRKPVIRTLLISLGVLSLMPQIVFADLRYDIIEDFESGSVNLVSWEDEDLSPNSWQLTSSDTHNGSAWSLHLYGNTWKQQFINPVLVDSGAVFQVAAKTANGAKIQGIGFSDGINELFYSFSGSRILDLETWVPVYQGAFSHGVWNLYQLPIASDWYSFFDYLPRINSLIYVNDLDGVSSRSFYLDTIIDISSDLAVAPTVSVSHQISFQGRNSSGKRIVGVQFYSSVTDPDSNSFTYSWDFGDSLSSAEANPYHIYTVTDNHPYRTTLRVTDNTGKWGLASCLVDVDQGPDTLPLRMNFVGDIMLERRYESGDGIIPNQGVNAIFTPTLDLLGNAADITVANLEVVLTNQGNRHPTKSVAYRGNPANISGLVYAGIDKVSLANNHTLDYGLEGLNQMTGLLEQNGIAFSGAGANSYEAYTPSFINRNGLNIAFLASSDRTGQYNNAQPYLQAGYNKFGFAYMTPYYMLQQLAAVEGVADLKVMELHGGSEYSLAPGSGYDKGNPFAGDVEDEDYQLKTDVPHMWDVAVRHFAIDSGADLVIVHHPHIIQGLEIYQGKLIAHSLGNFAFDLEYPETMPSMILYVDADREGFSNYTVKPVFIDSYIPKPATGQLGSHILDYLAMRSSQMNTKLMVDHQDMSARVLVSNTDANVTSHHYVYNQHLYPQSESMNLTPPFKLPRYGSIRSLDSVSPVSDSQARFGAETVWYGNFEDEGCTLWDVDEFAYQGAFDGLRSALLSPAAGNTKTATIKKRCKWYDNTKSFTLHGWIKTVNASSANIMIRYYNARDGYMVGSEYISADISGNTDWTWYQKELSIPANAWYYDIRLTCTNSGTGTTQAMFDNVGLIEWTPWAPQTELGDIICPNNYYWIQLKTGENPKSINVRLTEQKLNPASSARTHTPPVTPGLSSYPNPFKTDTHITFNVAKSSKTSLAIYNIRGQLVQRLAQGQLPEGKHVYTWNARNAQGQRVASGVYFVRLEQGTRRETRKIVLIH